MFTVAVGSMEIIHSATESDVQRAAARSLQASPALTERVLLEQLEYLLHHVGASCFPGCPDCIRLEQAKRPLLQPFS